MGWTGHRAEVRKIVNAHRNDFNSDTVRSFMNKFDGGYIGYVKSLGGIFKKYAEWNYPNRNRKIVSKIQFLEICEYVWGLYDIWGVDYSNGSNQGFEYNQYKGAYPFYTRADDSRYERNYAIKQHYTHEVPGIDRMLDPKNGYYAITNCAQGVLQVFKKAGLVEEDISDPAEYPDIWWNRGYHFKEITDSNKLQVGDVMIYATGSIGNKYHIRGWPDNFFHTNVIGEIAKDGTVYCYDSGHGYTHYYDGSCRHYFSLGSWPYDASDWVALRYDLTAKLTNSNFQWVEDKNAKKWHCYEIKDDKTKVELKGWHEVPWTQGVDWFYFDANGEMLTGWHDLKFGKNNSKKGRFYFDSNGAMKTEWQKIGGNWYYFEDVDGYLITNTMKKIKNKWYLFNEDGVMQMGTKTRAVSLNSSGQLIG